MEYCDANCLKRFHFPEKIKIQELRIIITLCTRDSALFILPLLEINYNQTRKDEEKEDERNYLALRYTLHNDHPDSSVSNFPNVASSSKESRNSPRYQGRLTRAIEWLRAERYDREGNVRDKCTISQCRKCYSAGSSSKCKVPVVPILISYSKGAARNRKPSSFRIVSLNAIGRLGRLANFPFKTARKSQRTSDHGPNFPGALFDQVFASVMSWKCLGSSL